LVAAVGDGGQFANGRQMAAALRLTPKQHSSGGKDRPLGISKRGDGDLGTELIHGARSAIRTCKGKRDRLSQWGDGLSGASPPQRGGNSTGEQDGAYCLGHAKAWHGLPIRTDRS